MVEIYRDCAVCGEVGWLVGVAYDSPSRTVFFCPRCIPAEFKMIAKELPTHDVPHLRLSWINLHDSRCPYTREQKERAERRMYAKAKEFGITLPKVEPAISKEKPRS